MNKRGFTLAELLISMIIMFVITGASIPIFFKKQKKPREDAKQNVILQYPVDATNVAVSCSNDRSNIINYSNIDLKGNYSNNEFFTIQLIGGGASGGKNKGGNAGEVKILYLPAMQGKYAVALGRGGEYTRDGNPTNGGITALYKLNDDNKSYTLIDYARGGISDNSEDATSNSSGSSGLEPSLNTSFDTTNCGRGGDKEKNGYTGSVTIWL